MTLSLCHSSTGLTSIHDRQGPALNTSHCQDGPQTQARVSNTPGIILFSWKFTKSAGNFLADFMFVVSTTLNSCAHIQFLLLIS